jgi:hypothetical protein
VSHVVNRGRWIAVECFYVRVNVFSTTKIQLCKQWLELTLEAPLVLNVICRREDCKVHAKTVFIKLELVALLCDGSAVAV